MSGKDEWMRLIDAAAESKTFSSATYRQLLTQQRKRATFLMPRGTVRGVEE